MPTTSDFKNLEMNDIDDVVRKQLLQKEFNTSIDSLSALYSSAMQ